MQSNKLIVFTLITIVVVVAATMMSHHRAPATRVEKQFLFPGLLEKINDVSTVELVQQGKSLSLLQQEKTWGIKQADNYPADFGKIRKTVIAVAELMIIAEKTSNTDLYERLGVENPAMDDASSLLLTLLDNDGKTLTALIVGKSRHSKAAQDKPGLYIRIPGAGPALLVEGQLDISADVTDWFKRDLFSIKSSRVKQIQITQADDNTVTLSRASDIDDFTMDDLPAGMEMQSNVIVSRMGTILEDIFVDDVTKADELAATQSTATIHTFDGLIISIDSAVLDDVNYSSFSFSVNDELPLTNENKGEETSNNEQHTPAEDAALLNKQMSGWAYAIPAFKYELFARKRQELVKEITPADGSTTNTGGTPASTSE